MILLQKSIAAFLDPTLSPELQKQKTTEEAGLVQYQEMDFWDEVERTDTIKYLWDAKSGRNIVYAATLNKLIEKLTSEDTHGNTYILLLFLLICFFFSRFGIYKSFYFNLSKFYNPSNISIKNDAKVRRNH